MMSPSLTTQASAGLQQATGLRALLGVPTGNQGPHGMVGVVDSQGL